MMFLSDRFLFRWWDIMMFLSDCYSSGGGAGRVGYIWRSSRGGDGHGQGGLCTGGRQEQNGSGFYVQLFISLHKNLFGRPL